MSALDDEVADLLSAMEDEVAAMTDAPILEQWERQSPHLGPPAQPALSLANPAGQLDFGRAYVTEDDRLLAAWDRSYPLVGRPMA